MSNPNPPSGGPPLRALAMILIALAIVFGGIGALSLSKSDSKDTSATSVTPSVAAGATRTNSPDASSVAATAAPTSAAASSSGSAAATTTAAASGSASSGAVDKSIPVRVYNNSSVTGLAAKTASTLESDGWTIAETGNYAQGDIPKTTVYYGNSPSEQAAAKSIAADIGASAEPRFAGIQGSGAGVIVIVTGN